MDMPVAASAHNALIDALPEDEYMRLAPALKKVRLQAGTVIYEANAPMRHVYFPATGVVGLLYEFSDGTPCEIALVGQRGLVGVALVGGVNTAAHRAVAQSDTTGYLVSATAFREALASQATLRDRALRYTQALMTQVAQIAYCNRHHDIQQQLCRWIMANMLFFESNHIEATQSAIADMLGVRRESITLAARKLQALGAIRYVRGRITVLDRDVLEACACECYRIVRSEYKALLDS
jgi:CRP-like cAMP-binding protein